MRPGPPSAALLILLAATSGVCQPVGGHAPPADLRSAILAADDARVRLPAHRHAVTSALKHGAPDARVLALRAMARTQRAEFLSHAIEGLQDSSIDVRREAAFAVAHIGSGAADAFPAAEQALRDAIERERDAFVFSALAAEYGRLPFRDGAALDEAARRLRAALRRVATPDQAPPLADLGVARAAEALARRAARLKTRSPDVVALLEALHDEHRVDSRAPSDLLRARTRRLAIAGLLSVDDAPPARFDIAATDPDAQVRRLAVIALSRRPTLTPEQALAWLRDDALIVRHAAVARVGSKMPAVAEAGTGDAHVNVRLAALDALGEARACLVPCTSRLDRPDPFGAQWQEAAHALVALARTHPQAARPHVLRAATAATWQARMHAARAAGLTLQPEVLERLSADPDVNVRHAALVALRDAKLPGVTSAAMAALASDDGQLVLEAAATLKGAAVDAAMVAALRGALQRLTAQRRETSRDPRIALLERVDEVDRDRLATVRAYLSDFDPAVAERAAGLLNARLGPGAARVTATPKPLPRAPVPSWDAVQRLNGATVTLMLRGDRRIALRLYAGNAPTAVARFVAQVRAGEWNGRTFHRVEPGFVVQGGSPAANEYAGADAFSRDEFSASSHVRGTVGISTRGPDTGDGQIFINLVDNVRLDYGFTLIGSVSGDAATIDDIVEGEVIEEARLTTPGQ